MKKTLAIVLAATLTTCAMGMTSFAEEAPAVMSYEEYIAAEMDTEAGSLLSDRGRQGTSGNFRTLSRQHRKHED